MRAAALGAPMVGGRAGGARPWGAMRAAALVALMALPVWAASGDVILKAMHDELERTPMLRVVNLDAPYFVEYTLEDADVFSVSATLGGLLGQSRHPMRALDVNLRVGSYQFDNTDYVFSGLGTAGGERAEMPLENNYAALRQALWLETDTAFKAAEEAIARKRAALQSVNVPDPLPDFAHVKPVQSLQASPRKAIDETAWKDRVVRLSQVFLGYPEIFASSVRLESIESASYLMNSEGSVIREPNNVAYILARAVTQAEDGMPLHDAVMFTALNADGLPIEAEARKRVVEMAENLKALVKAPKGESYTGPVMFEPEAAAQLFAQVLGDNLKITRKPVPQPGRPVPYLPSELEGRIGSRILPEWMDVVDDPTQKEWRGVPLVGYYDFDDQGVPPGPLDLVTKGVLKNFLLTRTPVAKGLEESNGRARLHGMFGAEAPGFGNLFVQASQTVTEAALKQKLIAMAKERGKAYGILVRKMDFPSSASVEELQRYAAAEAQAGGGGRPAALPVLVYKVYADGREELVRGLRFRGLTTRSLKDIVAASDEPAVFPYLDNAAPFALIGGANYIAPAVVAAPGVLFDELEMEPSQDELPKRPIVPSPLAPGA